MGEEYQFDVFGRTVAIANVDGDWVAFYLGQEGKRRRADFFRFARWWHG
ncbi:DUF7661 family protein [Paraburkholderia sp. HP33-1]